MAYCSNRDAAVMSEFPNPILRNQSRPARGTITDRIFRILMSNPDGTLTAYKISKLAGAHQYQVSLILRHLEDSKLVRRTSVTNYEGLLSKWARLGIKSQSQSYMLTNEMQILRNTKLPYALTTYRAESLVNRYLFPTRTDLYISSKDVTAWHNLFVEKYALVGGGNVRVRWYDDGVFYNSFMLEGYRIVSIPQLMVDLIREGGVAVQAEEMMLKVYDQLLLLNKQNRLNPFADSANIQVTRNV